MLGGKTLIDHGASLRGDLVREGSNAPIIAIGKYCIIAENASIAPPLKEGTTAHYYPVRIGDYVHVGANTKSEAVLVGSAVHIGQNCDIGAFSIIKDCVVIEDGSVVPPRTVLAPHTRWRGVPALEAGALPESAHELIAIHNRKVYLGVEGELTL